MGYNIIMRDFKLYFDNGLLDINVIDGYPEMLPYPNQTYDQRAALSALQEKGTIPGMLDTGVNWGAIYSEEDTMLQIDNDIKKAIQNNVTSTGKIADSYVPIYVNENGSIKVTVRKSNG